MKKWNIPEITDLNIKETASGWSHSGKEGSWVDDNDHAHGVHGGSKPGDDPYDPTKPSTPDTLS